MWERRGAYRVWWGDLSERDYLEDLNTDGKIILKWILEKDKLRAWAGMTCLRIGASDGLL
jgi:hypothetical protein